MSTMTESLVLVNQSGVPLAASGILLGGIFFGGIFLGGIFFGGIFLGGIFFGGIFLGGIFVLLRLDSCSLR